MVSPPFPFFASPDLASLKLKEKLGYGIGEVARALGDSPQGLRQKIIRGGLPDAHRRQNGYRFFSGEEVLRLAVARQRYLMGLPV